MTKSISAYAGSAGRTDGRDSNSWFTPARYIAAVTEALGGIDLDPMTSEEANRVVRAASFFTKEDDAFAHDWTAETVFLNPPYSGQMVRKSVDRMLDQYGQGNFVSGILLVNNATETRWFQQALLACAAVCFTDHRIAFWNADGKPVSGNTRGQAFFLFSDRGEIRCRFYDAFRSLGVVLEGGGQR